MSHQALTLQYRPVDFETVVGQDHIMKILREQVANDAAKSNYLFFGPRGTGKTSTARILAKALNCLNPDHGNPCNECAHCQAIADDSTLDIVEIDAASHTGVDNIREEIIAKVAYQPSQLRRKIYIIDEVHMLSTGAFNALLKVMEEPPAYVTFVLATTELHKIPETILSRCQLFQFHRVGREDMVARLQHIADQEKISADTDALGVIAKVSEGIMRDAVKYLDQVSVLGDVTVETVQQFLGMVGDQVIADMLAQLKSGDVTGAIGQLVGLQERGVDLSQFVKQVLAYIDEHFLDDMDHMARMSEVFSELFRDIKYYPYPLLAYKKSFARYVGMGQTPVVMTPQPAPAKTPAAQVPVEKTPQQTPPKKEPTPVTEPTPAITQKPTQTTPAPSGDYDAMKAQFVEQLSSKTTASLVKKYVLVDSVDGNRVQLAIINKIAEITLKKEATAREVEAIWSGILGESAIVEMTTLTKEEYAARLMG